MTGTDGLSLGLGIGGIVISVAPYGNSLLPRNAIPLVSARLNEAVAILDLAEAQRELTNVDEFRTDVEKYFTVVPSLVTH